MLIKSFHIELDNEGLVYRGEGNSSLVIALKNVSSFIIIYNIFLP
jgi:hypothetical protein